MVSARYILLVHSDLHQALQTSGLTVEWGEKVVAVGLMGKYLDLEKIGKIINLNLSPVCCRQYGLF